VLLALRGDRIPEKVGAESLHATELEAAVTALGHRALLLDIEDVEPAHEQHANHKQTTNARHISFKSCWNLSRNTSCLQ